MDYMEFSISLPPSVEFTNAGMEWANMKQRLQSYVNHSSNLHHHHGLMEAFLTSIAAEQVQEAFNMFGLTSNEALKFSQILHFLEDICIPRFLIIYNRYKFFTCRQVNNEKFDDFLRNLLNWSVNCEFGDLKDILLKDCIISGIPDIAIRQKLLKTEELDLAKTLNICRAIEKRNRVRNVLVNTDQIILVDASVCTENMDNVCVRRRQVERYVREFANASTKTKPDDFDIELTQEVFTESSQNTIKSGTRICEESEDNASISGYFNQAENFENCDNEHIGTSCPSYETANKQVVQLRRSKRHNKARHENLNVEAKINKKSKKNTATINNIKKLKTLHTDLELVKDFTCKDQEEINVTNRLNISKTDLVTNENEMEGSIGDVLNVNLIKTEATIIEKQDKKQKENNTDKGLKVTQKILVQKPKLGNHRVNKNVFQEAFMCSFCGKNFPDKKSISLHVQKCHKNGQQLRRLSLKCRMCKVVFKELAALKKHKLVHENEKKFQCDLCASQFGNPSHLKVHMRLHTGERPYTCDTCGSSYPEASKLKAHIRKHTGEKPYSCSVCSRSFAWTAAYNRHMRTHTGERPYTCEFCGVTFADFTSLQRHIRTHTQEKPYQCDKCSSKFTDPSALKLHIRIHNGERPYICVTCKASFTRSQHLKEHMKVHTGEKPFKCETCGGRFAEASKLKSHCRKHTGEKPYLCKICGRRFAWTAAYTRHMRTHTREKPYVCDYCGFHYADHSTLTRHRRTHTGERPYRCKICDSDFADNSSLHRHMRIHTGVKSYICEICGQSFAVKSYLVRHMRTHTGEKPYGCDVCGSKFTDSSKLNRHKKIHLKAPVKQNTQQKKKPEIQHYEQLQPVQQQFPSAGAEVYQISTNETVNSWTDDQHSLISVVHNLQHPVLVETTLPLSNAVAFNPSVFS